MIGKKAASRRAATLPRKLGSNDSAAAARRLACALALGMWACSGSDQPAAPASGGSPGSGGSNAATGGTNGGTGGSISGFGGTPATSGGANTTGGSSAPPGAGGSTPGPSGGAGSPGSAGSAGQATGGTGGAASGGSGPLGGTNSTAGNGATSGAGTGGAGTPVSSVCPYTKGTEITGQNAVSGQLQEFNDNGGWCWYQDERVIVDKEGGKLIIGSVASGGERDKRVEATHWDLATKTGVRHQLGTMSYTDDHDVQALVKRPEGGYAAMWAGHNDDCNSYYSVYDGTAWSKSASFAWPQCPTSSGKRITYANLWYLGDTLYSYVRSIDTSPHYLFSKDGGKTWELGGRLTSTPQVGYVAGYYKYWGNNVDRIDFFGTEAHPRDNDNSLYHGYVKDGKIHNSTGDVVDTDFADRTAQDVTKYTKVFGTGTTVNGARLEHMWNADVVRYDDGTIAAIGTGRVTGSGSDNPDKRLLYFRFDGVKWTTTYLARAGTKLYNDEQDYTGLGALHPDNPHVIYISTSYDPRTDEGVFTGKKEIWKGVTCDNGATFNWEPVTANSQMDNLRPVVPKWDASHTALLWLRGTYTSAQSYSFKVVGLVEEN